MRIQDIIFIGTFIFASFTGLFFPSFIAYLPITPSLCLMAILYLSFLNTSPNRLIVNFRITQKSFYKLIALKLFVLPIIVTAVFHIFLPQYALSALLLSGISAGVVTPIMATMFRADFSLSTIGLVGSCLLAPITLPLLVKIYACITASDLTLNISTFSMILFLSTMIVVPFILAQLTRLWIPRLHYMLQSYGFYLGLVFAFLVSYMIFANISEFLLSNLSLILSSFFISLLIAITLLLLTLVMTYGESRDQRLAIIIACCGINNMLAVIFCTDFFTPLETITTATYIIPFNMLVPVYRFLGWKLKHKNT